MFIAKVENGVITVGDYRELFPNTSFPVTGPDANFYQENSCAKVSMFKPHDRDTQMLMACDPYLEDNIVYTVQVVEKPEPVIIEVADTVSNGTGAV
jgi:hypothetical protein